MRSEIITRIIDFFYSSRISNHVNFVNKSYRWSSEEIVQYHEYHLRKLIPYCYENVPYYRRCFDALGLRPEMIKTIKDLSLLSTLSRSEVIDNYDDLLSSKYKKYQPTYRRTGGTTGIPLRYISTRGAWSINWALKFRDWSMMGYQIGDKMALLGGSSLIPDKKPPLKRRFWNSLLSITPLSMSHYDDEQLSNYYTIIRKSKIRFLRGYPSSIFMFAEFLEEKKLYLDIDGIFTTAEVLLPYHKEKMEKVFRCRVYDQYGSADAGVHGSSCRKSGKLHLSFEPSIVEVIDSHGEVVNSGQGEIVCTNLFNYAMPLLRYKPADQVQISTDSCGCDYGGLLIDKIIGRTTEILEFSNGQKLGGPAFTLIFRDFNLKQYQIVQEKTDTVHINLIPNELYTTEEENRILDIMRYHCGDEVEIKINYPRVIESASSSKFRFIYSKI